MKKIKPKTKAKTFDQVFLGNFKSRSQVNEAVKHRMMMIVAIKKIQRELPNTLKVFTKSIALLKQHKKTLK